MTWAHVPMQHAKNKIYTRLPTYKRVIVDQCSMNLELLSRLPIAVYITQVESLRLLEKDPLKLVKAYVGL
jgi:hypothetical protein